MSDLSSVKALVFDVFGTVVDWRTSLITDLMWWGKGRGISADWTALVDGWRGMYTAAMDDVRKHPERGYVILDVLHRRSLDKLVEKFAIKGLTEADLDYITKGWHRLHPWPDSVAGLTRLKSKFVISPLSNGNVALLTNMAKFAGLPWDLIMSAELFEHYKPDPETYLGAARLLGLKPEQVMMVAAHNGDLAAAQKNGLKTAFVARPTEYGPLQKVDFGLGFIVQWRMEVAVDPGKPVDLVLTNGLVDRGDGRQACIPDRLRVIPPKFFDQLAHPRVGHHREVRARMSGVGHSAAVALKNGDSFPGFGQQIRRGQAGDTGSDDDHIGHEILVELGKLGKRCRRGPVGRGVNLFCGHRGPLAHRPISTRGACTGFDFGDVSVGCP